MSVILYASSLFGMLLPAGIAKAECRVRSVVVRCVWTAAFLAYLAHVLLAFHYFHQWSHAAAYERVAREGGFGAGLYLNYAFTIAWGMDVAFWWCGIERYAARPVWINHLLHSFMLFMVFNGSVVFATGLTRWVSLAAFGLLGVYGAVRLGPWLLRRLRTSRAATH